MKTIAYQFSRYNAPITNKYPNEVTTLYRIYMDITGNTLKKETLAVRANASLKPKILPYITVSGIFKERSLAMISSYSCIIGIDLDHVDIALKTKIFCDPFLNPALIFVSPSGSGLKIFIRTEGGIPEQHNDYFNAISTYLYLNYGVTADPACRDISRACFLCHDYNSRFSATGRVSAADLLEISSPAGIFAIPVVVETHGGASHGGTSLSNIGASSGGLAPHSSCYDPYKVKIVNRPHDNRSVKSVKSNPAVHALAEQTLLAHGWHQNGDKWTRPGKEVRDGKSAVFNAPNAEGVYIFTVFSSNAHPFEVRGYNDFQIIALLDYAGDLKTCFNVLTTRFNL